MILAYFRKSFERQLALLALSTVLAALLSIYCSVEPRVRLNAETLFRGILAAFITILILGVLHLLLLLVFGKRHEEELSTWTERQRLDSTLLTLSGSMSLAVAQELILRGYIFSWLLLISPLLAYGGNAVLSFLLHFEGRKTLGIAFLRAIEGSMYALMYASNRSLAMLAIAHFIVDYLVRYTLTNTKKSWIPHALSIRQQHFPSRRF